jgi:uncharacterized protein
MFLLSIAFGGLVGFALGMTGGGGSLLAVPLLVYGLAMAPREAFGVSLAAVGATALIGVVPRIRAGQVEVRTALLFAVAGMLGAPLGTWTAAMIPETALLIVFAALMLVVAWRMWSQATGAETSLAVDESEGVEGVGPTCRRTADGRLRLTSRCAMLLAVVGLTTGYLSGMFGVGGGFVIVPALVVFTGMSIHRAVATSLLVMVLVSISGVASHFAAGRAISLEITALFVAGGVGGMSLGGFVGKRLPAAVLQKVFATGIVAVAIFIVSKTLV